MDDRACSRCSFWDADPGRGLSGWCRFNPPIQVHDVNQVIKSNWPPTRSEDWCGQFKVRPTPPAPVSVNSFEDEF